MPLMSGAEAQDLPEWLLDIWDDFLDLRTDLLASGNLTTKEKNLLSGDLNDGEEEETVGNALL